MNKLLQNTRFVDDFSLIERKERELNDARFKKLILEKGGSYPGQFEEAENIAEKLLKNGFKETSYIFKEHIYRLKIDYQSLKGCHGETFDKEVIITVNPSIVKPYSAVSTIAHEIMHVFQQKLEKIDGVSEESMFFYNYVLSFANAASLRFSSFFFYALYYCFSIERKANVSSIANFLQGYFGDKRPTSEEIEKALEECDKYMPYVEFLDYFSSTKPTIRDIQYIEYCMTQDLKNPFSNSVESLYNPDTFDCEAFIKGNVKQIIKVCKDTIKKMHKNVMLFLDKNHGD